MIKSHLHDLLHAGPGFVGSTGFLGATPGVAIDNTAPFAIHNPSTSSRRVYLVQASLGYISGTPGAGEHVLCYNDTVGQAAPTGTQTTIKPARMMNTETSLCTAWRNATLPNNANVYHPFGPSDSTGGGPKYVTGDYYGYLQVDPGGILSMQFIGTAGAAPVFHYGFLWVEVPI